MSNTNHLKMSFIVLERTDFVTHLKYHSALILIIVVIMLQMSPKCCWQLLLQYFY